MKDIIKTRKKTLAILFGAVILFAFSCLYSTHPRPVETEDRDAGLNIGMGPYPIFSP